MNAIYITFDGITDPLGQSQVLPYLKSLSKQGIVFYLVSLEKNAQKAKALVKNIEDAGIFWYRLPYIKFYFLGTLINIIRCFFVVFYLLSVKKIQIIHARSYLSLFSALLLKKIFNFKLIFDMRGFWPEELTDSGRITHDSISYKILKFLEKKSIASSDCTVTLTPEAKEIVEEKFKVKNVVWMPTCVDESRFENGKPGLVTSAFTLIYSGSLWSFYNMPAMVDFFVALKSKISNAHFLILGNNETKRLHDLFLQKGLQKQDYTVTTSKPEDVSAYLSGSQLGISFRYDFYSQTAAFPTKLAEYLISGLPVVINSKSDYIKNMVNSNHVGVVVDVFDRESLYKAVDDLLMLMEDKNLKQRCIQTAKTYLGQRVCVDKYLDIYRKLG